MHNTGATVGLQMINHEEELTHNTGSKGKMTD